MNPLHLALASLMVSLAGCATTAQHDAPANTKLDHLETKYLSSPVQLTTDEMFVKAGEQYFSPDMQWIIFQAVPHPPEGRQPDADYSMYVAKLRYSNDNQTITGIEEPILISNPGSANTCGWFHPSETGRVLWGSTITPPKSADTFQGQESSGRDRRRYAWSFHENMEIVAGVVPQILGENSAIEARPLFERPHYDAEGSWSDDGRFVLYTHVRDADADAPADADLWVYDTKTGTQTELVAEPGYDGGPFFSPDGRSICYRSDRRGNQQLQIFVADLAFGDDGSITGIEREYQLTDNDAVNWAPFWHPSGQFMVYASSETGHANFEVLAIETDMPALRNSTAPGEARRARITFAPGADILPVISKDGRFMIWTSQRGGGDTAQGRPASQLWIARLDPSFTPDNIFHRVGKDDAELLAKVAAGASAPWADRAIAQPQQTPMGWNVLLKERGGQGRVSVTLSADGRVVSMETDASP